MVVVAAAFVFMMAADGASGAEISIPAVGAKPGEAVAIPVILDRVANLAGVKLVMAYNPDLLVFSKAEKTRFTNGMMHIINDKKPGTLIVVMAAARGVKGENFPIMTMEFKINTSVKAPAEATIKINEAQLMSDDLKDIPCTFNMPPVKILDDAPLEQPDKEETEAGQAKKGEGDQQD